MGRIPPTADQAELLETAQECYCCQCMRCDFNIGTIEVVISGTFSLVEEYESPTDPGFYDRKEASGSWSITGSFVQVLKSEGAGLGEFHWANGAWLNGDSGHCVAENNPNTATDGLVNLYVIGRGTHPGGPYHVTQEFQIRTLVTAVEDPEIVISDTTTGYDFSLISLVPSYDYTAEHRWIISAQVEGYDILGDTAAPMLLVNSNPGITPPNFELPDSSMGAMAHPAGDYVGTFDDSLSTGGGSVFKNWVSSINVSITVNGYGFRDCDVAAVIFPP